MLLAHTLLAWVIKNKVFMYSQNTNFDSKESGIGSNEPPKNFSLALRWRLAYFLIDYYTLKDWHVLRDFCLTDAIEKSDYSIIIKFFETSIQENFFWLSSCFNLGRFYWNLLVVKKVDSFSYKEEEKIPLDEMIKSFLLVLSDEPWQYMIECIFSILMDIEEKGVISDQVAISNLLELSRGLSSFSLSLSSDQQDKLKSLDARLNALGERLSKLSSWLSETRSYAHNQIWPDILQEAKKYDETMVDTLIIGQSLLDDIGSSDAKIVDEFSGATLEFEELKVIPSSGETISDVIEEPGLKEPPKK